MTASPNNMFGDPSNNLGAFNFNRATRNSRQQDTNLPQHTNDQLMSENQEMETILGGTMLLGNTIHQDNPMSINDSINITGRNSFEEKKYFTLDDKKLKAKKEAEDKICRICLGEEEPDNPIISPCSCTGSVKFIHLECIKEWLEGKKHKKETPIVNSYIWRGLECEICKAFYEDQVTLPNGKRVSLLRFDLHEDAE